MLVEQDKNKGRTLQQGSLQSVTNNAKSEYILRFPPFTGLFLPKQLEDH